MLTQLKIKKQTTFNIVIIKGSLQVGVRRLELPTSTSRTWRAANCATPRLAFSVQIYKLFFISPYFFAIFLLDNLLFSENY